MKKQQQSLSQQSLYLHLGVQPYLRLAAAAPRTVRQHRLQEIQQNTACIIRMKTAMVSVITTLKNLLIQIREQSARITI